MFDVLLYTQVKQQSEDGRGFPPGIYRFPPNIMLAGVYSEILLCAAKTQSNIK